MSRVLSDWTSRRLSGGRSLPWRSGAAHIVVALAAAMCPAGAGATTADDLCAGTADPCRVTSTVLVTPGSLIDVGTRQLVIANHGALSLSSGTMTLRAGTLTVDIGGSLQARGTAQDPGGKIIAVATAIALNGGIDATGAPGGAVTLTSTEALTLAGTLDVRSRSGEDAGGSADLQGGDVTITAAGRISALGGLDDFGGDISVRAAGTLVVNGPLNVSGGDGGSIDLTSAGSLTVGPTVSLDADATAGGGNGGDISLSAIGDATVGGVLSAVGRNGSVDTSAGDGGTVSVEGSSITATLAAVRITVDSGSPDGIGGDIELTSNSGGIDYRGRLEASGPGGDGNGGSVVIDAASTAAIAGVIDVTGGSNGGGDLEVSSGTDVTVAAGASLSVAANSNGAGGDIELSAGQTVAIDGALISDGGNMQGATGGSITLSACTVRINSDGSLSSLRSGGANTLTGRDLTIVGGTLRAELGTGRNTIRFAGPDYEPAFLPGAQINPPVGLVPDAAVIPCNPVSTRTPTASPTVPATAGASPTVTPTATPTPIVCVGDCDGSGTVGIADLVIGVNIALGSQPIMSCPAFDPGGDGKVGISELVQGVNNALNGCP